ncbi:uncharacterized protein LOC105261656 [Musca domestica]|uniref:Uncharacterized protein LOC105261656 n=1 Tax=Musca domestica TaxID=7370 RepID=A0A1I8NIW0_MUSDO|nr:uncharacterized protein LOC105261656 [Musca domestica]
MKFLLLAVIVATAAVQISLGISVAKRSVADGKDNFKAMMADVKSRVQANVKAIPDMEAYAKYKNEFSEILKEFDEPNDKVVCSAKMVAILDKLYEAINKVKADDSESARKILEIARANKDENFDTNFKAGLEYARHPEVFEEEYC